MDWTVVHEARYVMGGERGHAVRIDGRRSRLVDRRRTVVGWQVQVPGRATRPAVRRCMSPAGDAHFRSRCARSAFRRVRGGSRVGTIPWTCRTHRCRRVHGPRHTRWPSRVVRGPSSGPTAPMGGRRKLLRWQYGTIICPFFSVCTNFSLAGLYIQVAATSKMLTSDRHARVIRERVVGRTMSKCSSGVVKVTSRCAAAFAV